MLPTLLPIKTRIERACQDFLNKIQDIIRIIQVHTSLYCPHKGMDPVADSHDSRVIETAGGPLTAHCSESIFGSFDSPLNK